MCGEGFLQDVHYTLRESFFKCVLELPELWVRFALHMPGKNYIMEKWTKKSESTNTKAKRDSVQDVRLTA